VTTRDGDSSGPPGVGLVASGENYTCSRVDLDFAGDPIGQSHITGGTFRTSDLIAPADARPGTYSVTADCGSGVVASAPFTLTDDSVHRTPLATALPTPADISFSPADLARSAAAAAVAIPIIFFPFALIEEVMDDHYEEILGWFGLRARHREKAGWAAVPKLVMFIGLAAATYTALDPSAGLNVATVVVFLGLLVALTAVIGVAGVPSLAFAHRHGLKAPMRALPGSLVVAVVVVILCRLIHFHPGYAFGAVAGFYVACELERREEGRLALGAVLSILGVSLLAWVAWLPVSRMAAVADPGLGVVILETALVSTFMVGLETCLVLSLPIRFVPGGEVVAWSKRVWAVMFAVVLFPVVHILFGSRSAHTLVTNDVHPLVILGVSAFFAVFTIGFWSYFRFRPERPHSPAAA
jgi:hypothetical protein